MDQHDYLAILEPCGGTQRELSQKSRWAALQEWRHVFAAALHSRTGKWKLGKYEWEALGAPNTPALSGARAVYAYFAEHPRSFVVIPEELTLPAFTCYESTLPDFTGAMADVYVWPSDLDWTAAFTHEADCGPYFARRDWVKRQTARQEGPS